MLKQEELVEIIDTTGPGSLVFGEEHEVTLVDIVHWTLHHHLIIMVDHHGHHGGWTSFKNYIFLS